MNETEFAGALADAIRGDPTDFDGAKIKDFADAGIGTYNVGLVVRLPDGTEYQVTVVRSR